MEEEPTPRTSLTSVPTSDDQVSSASVEIVAELPVDDPSRSPTTSWPAWTAPLALVTGLVFAAVAGLIVDLPALLLGANVSSTHTPPGLSIADTFVQEIAFVLAAVFCGRLGGRSVSAWQFGLRPPGVGWRAAIGRILLLLFAFIALSAVWSVLFHPSEEKLLEQLGSNEGTALLLLSAALTCVAAPMAEEFLFRGYIFTALRNWKGTLPAALITGLLFGGVHAGSALRRSTSCRWRGSGSGCACCTDTPALCTRAWSPTR